MTAHTEIVAAARTAFIAQGIDDPPLVWVESPDGDAIGVVIVVHGGAWYLVGEDELSNMSGIARRWRDRGWCALNVDYRPLAPSMGDVLTWFDAVRDHVGANVPVGLHGSSAGGHMALMVAVERDGVNFVVAEGAPTDLGSLGGNPEADDVRWRFDEAFGVAARDRLSPVRRADEIDARIVLATCTTDEKVPVDQLRLMHAALPGSVGLELTAGDRPFVHAWIDEASQRALFAAEEALARPQ